jgi:hypothetical protein
VTFRGGSEFTDDGADELDGMLRSLGPHALEPAVFTGEYDGEVRVVSIDPARNVFPAPDGIPIRGLSVESREGRATMRTPTRD